MNQGDLAASLPWFVESLKIDDGHPTRQATHRLRFESVLRHCPQPVRMWFGKGRIVSADLSPDGTKVVRTDGSSQAYVHDIATDESLTLTPTSDNVELAAVIFSHDGKQVVLADYNSKKLFIADAKTGEWKTATNFSASDLCGSRFLATS